jgi:thymidylate synthase
MQHIQLNQIIIRPLDVVSIKNFIRHLISQYEDKNNIQMQASNLFLLYNQWATDNNIVVNSNPISFGLQFRKIKIPHIKRRGKKVNIILFIINEVKEMYK